MAGRAPDEHAHDNTLLVTTTGEERTMAWRHTLLQAADGTPTGTLSSGEDITERLRHEAEIRRLAFHDPLTGLANRSHFDTELRAAIAGGAPVGLLFVDLDDFKLVNDTLGHAAGDELLCAVADRLEAGGDLVGRHGGDEFLVLLRGTSAAAGAAADVTARLAEPYTIGGRALRIRASVGAATCPGDADDAEGLLRRADVAMYRAKRAGR
jgi:diguanylate cyclase (GGDEF)-like protein